MPLTFNGNNIREKNQDKYLGDIIHSSGSEKSVEATVNDRYWRIYSGILEIKTIMEDCRIETVGGMSAGLDLWELALIPALLNNAESWDSLNDTTLKKCNDLQNTCLRYLLNIPRTTPIPALNWDTGVWPMEYRIMAKKLIFMHHVMNLSKDALARQIMITQKTYHFPGLVNEIKQLVRELDIPDITDEQTAKQWTKESWKK